MQTICHLQETPALSPKPAASMPARWLHPTWGRACPLAAPAGMVCIAACQLVPTVPCHSAAAESSVHCSPSQMPTGRLPSFSLEG